MSDKVYDIIKIVALLLAPLCTFVVSILGIFHIIDNDIAVALSSAVDIFLGALVTVAKKLYDEKHAKSTNEQK